MILPITKKYFDMILSGEKKEEYRELKPYYKSRIQNYGLVEDSTGNLLGGRSAQECYLQESDIDKALRKGKKIFLKDVVFKNGYSNVSRSFKANCEVTIGKGKEEWGAEPNKEYYVLNIQKVF